MNTQKTSISFRKKNQRIVDRMKDIGIQVIDVSIYTTDYIDEKAPISVIVGYVPYNAAIFSVHVGAGGDMAFYIDGQVRNDKRYAPVTLHQFDKIQRPVSTGGYFGRLEFSIDVYIPCYEEGDPIDKGIRFFEEFIDLYFKALETNFTEHIMLHVTPYHSDEYKKLAAKYSPTSLGAPCYFENRIKKKLPHGFIS